MKKLISMLLLFPMLSFFSCTEKYNYIYYTYNGVVITRIDQGNVIRFYYGKIDLFTPLPTEDIKATFSGFNSSMDSYMIFKENKKIQFIVLDGQFEEETTSDTLKLIEFDHNIDFIKWSEKIKGNYENKIRLSNSINLEISQNKQNNSLVKATYPENN